MHAISDCLPEYIKDIISICMQNIHIEKKYYDGVLCLLRGVIEKTRVRQVHKKRILTGLQSRLESTRATQQVETMSGFSRMQACRDALSFLDENGWRRSYHQRLFHDDFIRACIRLIFNTTIDVKK